MKIHRFLPLALLVLALAFAGFTFAAPAIDGQAVDGQAVDGQAVDARVLVTEVEASEAPVDDEAASDEGASDEDAEAVFPWPETFTDMPSVGPGQECLANCVIALQGCLQRCVQPNGSLNPSCVSQCELDFDECSGECNS